MEVQKIWKLGAQVVGIKNRCRKSDFHQNMNLHQMPYNTNHEDLKKLATNYANEYVKNNFKSVQKVVATATLFTIENGCETWEVFNDSHNLKFKIN